MAGQSDILRGFRQHEDLFAVTRRGVFERLTDPYLTEHDRWVLGQFAQFLSGVAPGPDHRARQNQPSQLASARYARVRRAAA